MNATILQRFLAVECSPYVRDLMRTALELARSGAGPRRKRFEFNLFEVSFDLDEGVVLIEEVLNAGEDGMQSIPMDAFLLELNKKQY